MIGMTVHRIRYWTTDTWFTTRYGRRRGADACSRLTLTGIMHRRRRRPTRRRRRPLHLATRRRSSDNRRLTCGFAGHRSGEEGLAMADVSRLPGPNADFWDWQLRGSCRGTDSDLFFHPEGERGQARTSREEAAKEVCLHCPVCKPCREHALRVHEPYGV